MTHQEKLAMLEEVLILTPGTLNGRERLRDLPGWDSSAILAFMSEADEKCKVTIEPDSVAASKTVDDLIGLLPTN